ncbi:MAG TPA: tubulin-like doman-containing protein [Pyrinomonadaceae bacterium]|nr:tubulin-like doman-containing protein [Pyrinomonadaceae bacterium]
MDEWWPKNIPIQAINAGAGQVRARGRLVLFAKIGDIMSRVGKALDDVRLVKYNKQMYAERFDVSEREDIEIYIVGSLAGGTGSGMFLDVAFIARHHAETLSPSTNITGVLALPRVFQRLPGTTLVKPNAYGALKEIERFTTLSSDDNFSINYGRNVIPIKRPPFDLLYLIDSVNESGQVISETSDLLSLIADGLYIQIGSQIGTDSDNAVDNIKTQLSVAGRVRGRSASYCSFGVASLSLPIRQYEIMMIDSARKLLSDGLLNGAFPDSELEQEVVRFIETNKLREDNADDVIDALIEREDGGRVRFSMPLGSVTISLNLIYGFKQVAPICFVSDAHGRTRLSVAIKCVDRYRISFSGSANKVRDGTLYLIENIFCSACAAH